MWEITVQLPFVAFGDRETVRDARVRKIQFPECQLGVDEVFDKPFNIPSCLSNDKG